jgi:uncharacterized protein YndB with AHSA1/START domain
VGSATATRAVGIPATRIWELLAEPYHLPDWWPEYVGVEPDRRGLAAGARWTVSHGRRPGLLRRAGGEGLLVIERVEPGRALAWRDLARRYAVAVELERDTITVTLEAAGWRLLVERLDRLPERALRRLEALCETAESL